MASVAKILEFRRPFPQRLSRHEFKTIVVEMAAEGRLTVRRHLYRDHPERNISQAMIERCIERGTVQTDPYVNAFGNYQAEIYRHMSGQELTVVAAIEWETQVIVVTAF